METTAAVKSGLSTGMAILGLVLAILALLIAFVPLLGLLAVLLAVPAAIVSLVALIIALARKAPSGLSIGALLVSLVAAGVSGSQFAALWKVGEKAQEGMERMLTESAMPSTPAKAVSQAGVHRPIVQQIPVLEPACSGRFVEIPNEWYPLRQLLPIESEASRFPRLSRRPLWVFAFTRMNDDLLTRLKIEECIKGDELYCFTKEGFVAGELRQVKLSDLDGFKELYSTLKTLDTYGREAKRDEIIACLKSIQQEWFAEIDKYTRTPFNITETILANEEDYDLEKKLLQFTLSIGGAHIGTVNCVLPLDRASDFFKQGEGPVGKRVRTGKALFTVLAAREKKCFGLAGGGLPAYSITSVRPLTPPRVVFQGEGSFTINAVGVGPEFWKPQQDVGHGWGNRDMGSYSKTRMIDANIDEFFPYSEQIQDGLNDKLEEIQTSARNSDAPTQSSREAQEDVQPRPASSAEDSPLSGWSGLLKRRVDQEWQVPSGISSNAGLKAEISFRVDRKGNLIGQPKIVQGSSNSEFDDAGVKTILKVAPFPPLPDDYKGDEQAVIYVFRLEGATS